MSEDTSSTPLSLTVRNLGPIRSLEGILSPFKTNLIFARNGTGKTFLARALRCIDLSMKNQNICDAHHLVSRESDDRSGQLCVYSGTKCIGSLKVNGEGSEPSVESEGAIFHVFSEEFTQSELVKCDFSPGLDADSFILVDKDNIAVKNEKDERDRLTSQRADRLHKLEELFNTQKDSYLVERAHINRSLSEYKKLNMEYLLGKFVEKPALEDGRYDKVIEDIRSLSQMPENPAEIATVPAVRENALDRERITASLEKISELANIASDDKSWIEENIKFIKIGVDMLSKSKSDLCPFCAQEITSAAPQKMIDLYQCYLNGEEDKHKSELTELVEQANAYMASLDATKESVCDQLRNFDNLKRYSPDHSEESMVSIGEPVRQTKHAIHQIVSLLQMKHSAINEHVATEGIDWEFGTSKLNKVILENNNIADDLNNALAESTDRRLKFQRDACGVFAKSFAISHWSIIDEIKKLDVLIMESKKKIRQLETQARTECSAGRIAESFARLLAFFFGDKYTFDVESARLLMNTMKMNRNAIQTLSAGEMSVISFCYFIAKSHAKVSTNDDYENLLLVFDDPVNSVSHEYIFKIAHVFKHLSFTKSGRLKFDSGGDNSCMLPGQLILTHNSYLFNVLMSSRAVKPNSTFTLVQYESQHQISGMLHYITPFQNQLRDILGVVNGAAPDHTTASSARSVLEAIGKFCHPTQSKKLANYIRYLSVHENKQIHSTLLNNLSHGDIYLELPSSEEIREACEEVVDVVRRFAPGQIDLVEQTEC